MGNRRLRTEADLLADKKESKHKRDARIDDAVAYIIVVICWFLTAVTVCAVSYMAYLYFYVHMTHPEAVSPEVISTIETLGKLGFGGIGGYLTHFLKRNMDQES